MATNDQKPLYDLGGLPATAPSVQKIDVKGWLLAGGLLGATCGWLALTAAWRPLPGLPAPPGSLAFHAHQSLLCAAHWLIPSAFGGEAKAYGALLAKLDAAERLALGWRAGLGALAACAPMALLARPCLAPRDGLIALRGSARHEGRAALDRLNAKMAAGAKARPDHPIAPGVPYPADMWTRHVLVVAGTGAGKSTVLKPLIEKIIGAGESLLLFDPKGEFTKGFGGPEILAPWDARSLAWDIAKDMRNIGDMRRFAAAMVREAQDPMWSNAARQLLVGFMIYLKATRILAWGWRELAEMLATPQANILPIMSEYHPEAVRAVERASVTTQGILINLASFSASIFDLAEAWGDAPPERRVSFVEWAQQRGRHRQLILQGHGAYPDLTKSYLEGVVGTVAAIVNSVEMDDDESRKLWLVADECGQMGRLPIRALLELGRSRGFRCVLACQDLAQFEEIYGALMVKAMVSMVGTILVGQLMQGDTAEQLCKALGTREVERQNISSSQNGSGFSGRSTTLSFSRDELAIYKPSELASRLGPTPDRKGVKLALCAGGNAYELFWPHHKMTVARPAHVPAPWTVRFGPALDASGAEGKGEGRRKDGGRDEGLGEVKGEMAPPLEAGAPRSELDFREERGAAMEGGGRSQSEIGLSGLAASSHGSGQLSSEGEAISNGAARRAPPSAAEVTNLLRQSVEVHSLRAAPGSHRHGALSGSHAGGGAADRSAASQQGAGPSSEAHGREQAHEAGPLAEALGELLSEGAEHVVGEGAAALRHGVELLDALRPKPGPMQVVVQTQRPPADPQRPNGGPAPVPSKEKAKERSS